MEGIKRELAYIVCASVKEGLNAMSNEIMSNKPASTDYSVIEFTESLQASFIGTGKPADERYSPRVLVNDKENATDILTILKSELADCVSFDFSVAFVTSSGIQTLVEVLNTLKARGIPGRILTSTYLNFNDPAALKKLLEYPNIKTRVFEGDLHAKGFFFNKERLSTFIIGSSNLTQKALTCNKEWNILFRSYSNGEILFQARHEFESLWNDGCTVEMTSAWIDQYDEFLKTHPVQSRARVTQRKAFSAESTPLDSSGDIGITPNGMQKSALEALRVLHAREERRALLISATGTGKTYLSAFDVQAEKPKRVLFLAHRKRILSASMESFERVLGDAYSYCLYGEGGESDKSCVFAMINTVSRHLDDFDPVEFDYIVIDEAHRTGAASYQKVLAYFRPRFFLGMTATPSRTDGYDVYSLFNHVIAYRITLQDALQNRMLAPFHYFGIADIAVNGEEIDDLSSFAQLTSSERVQHLVEKIEEYSVEKENRRGLIFCSRNDEAAELSRMMNERGYRTIAISGDTSEVERDCAISRLERGDLEYVLSVDILNEGIDIPTLNQIVMLRPTESAVVFMQQLGRGLRTHDEKEFTLVLDFIGNYQQNFLIPMALSGDRTYNKDTLRRVVKEGSVGIPGCSTISFDAVSERRIFKALENGRFGDAKLIRSEYQHLKQVLGRLPRLVDFDANEAIDPMIIIRKHGSYASFLQAMEKDEVPKLDSEQLSVLKFLSMKLASGKRYLDLAMLRALLEAGGPVSVEEIASKAADDEVEAARLMLSGRYSTSGQEVVEFSHGRISFSPHVLQMLDDPYFREMVSDLVDFGLSRNERDYRDLYKDTDFVLYQKYSREEVCRLLRWAKEPNYQNIGGYFHDKATNTFPVFIDYEKDPSISVTTQYEDRFVSEGKIIAISKSKRTLSSPEILNLRKSRESGMRCFLFMRKNKNDKDESKEFYFLGEIYPTGDFTEIVMADDVTRAVEITYELDVPVRGDLYDYLTSDLDF